MDFGQDAVLIDKIALGHHENNFTVEFSSLNFTKPKLAKYAYKLEGFDKDWVFVGNQNTAVYANLSGGGTTPSMLKEQTQMGFGTTLYL